MLVNIALNAATVCTARACTKRLDETQWPETRDETYCAETETRLETHRPRPHPCKTSRRDAMARDSRRDLLSRDRDILLRDRDETLVRLETVSRPRRLNRDHIPAVDCIIAAAANDFGLIAACVVISQSRKKR